VTGSRCLTNPPETGGTAERACSVPVQWSSGLCLTINHWRLKGNRVSKRDSASALSGGKHGRLGLEFQSSRVLATRTLAVDILNLMLTVMFGLSLDTRLDAPLLADGFDDRALFSSQKILQNFSDSLSHRIFRHIHEVLNIDKNKN